MEEEEDEDRPAHPYPSFGRNSGVPCLRARSRSSWRKYNRRHFPRERDAAGCAYERWCGAQRGPRRRADGVSPCWKRSFRVCPRIFARRDAARYRRTWTAICTFNRFDNRSLVFVRRCSLSSQSNWIDLPSDSVVRCLLVRSFLVNHGCAARECDTRKTFRPSRALLFYPFSLLFLLNERGINRNFVTLRCSRCLFSLLFFDVSAVHCVSIHESRSMAPSFA